MKTLKEELQEIVDKDLLTKNSRFICVNLFFNTDEFENYKNMASKYAKDFWWGGNSWWDWESELECELVISEKYRFIKDLIAIL